ncbi:response regulator [Flavobacterium sp. MFBS3-15]|uniref:response regulator n=1 Tax=Flavobacterium sp. MFBS3-15 TaxID=2989816 RepID=UPI0022356828|nr:response regulator [Flavobacterium sp. MFBS3-15]MCW4470482.1 response regulator [Flavobacterium sp. MFBS3-15]
MKKVNSLYVIDDDKIYHFLLKSLLKQNGIDIESTFFVNGQEAIDYISQGDNIKNLPDLILLDVNMPIMDGWQFLEEFAKLGNGISRKPVIYMISSSNNEVDINKAKEFNATVKDYFLKPICKEDIEKIFIG